MSEGLPFLDGFFLAPIDRPRSVVIGEVCIFREFNRLAKRLNLLNTNEREI